MFQHRAERPSFRTARTTLRFWHFSRSRLISSWMTPRPRPSHYVPMERISLGCGAALICLLVSVVLRNTFLRLPVDTFISIEYSNASLPSSVIDTLCLNKDAILFLQGYQIQFATAELGNGVAFVSSCALSPPCLASASEGIKNGSRLSFYLDGFSMTVVGSLHAYLIGKT